MNAKPTDTQTAILEAAASRPDGSIEPLAAHPAGGARGKVIAGLLARELITEFQDTDHVGYYLTDAGYAAVGRKREAPPPLIPDVELEAAITASEAKWRADAVTNRDAADGIQNCKPQTLQTSVCTLPVAKRRARAPRIEIPPGRTRSSQGSPGSCIQAGMSRWPCSTRQTSMWSARST